VFIKHYQKTIIIVVFYLESGLTTLLLFCKVNKILKYKKKEGITIQQIAKLQKEYGIKNNIIQKKIHRTAHDKYYVDDFIAMKIWIALGVNSDKVYKIKKDIEERKRMSNELY
jgi:hypothetical protein